jgi:hypothetical protein
MPKKCLPKLMPKKWLPLLEPKKSEFTIKSCHVGLITGFRTPTSGHGHYHAKEAQVVCPSRARD